MKEALSSKGDNSDFREFNEDEIGTTGSAKRCASARMTPATGLLV